MIKLTESENRTDILVNPAFILSVYENRGGYTKVKMSDGTLYSVNESLRTV